VLGLVRKLSDQPDAEERAHQGQPPRQAGPPQDLAVDGFVHPLDTQRAVLPPEGRVRDELEDISAMPHRAPGELAVTGISLDAYLLDMPVGVSDLDVEVQQLVPCIEPVSQPFEVQRDG